MLFVSVNGETEPEIIVLTELACYSACFTRLKHTQQTTSDVHQNVSCIFSLHGEKRAPQHQLRSLLLEKITAFIESDNITVYLYFDR